MPVHRAGAGISAFFAGRAPKVRLITLVIAAFVALPILSVIVLAAGGSDIWGHLWRTVLPHYTLNTLQLLAGVGLGTVMVGTGAAWLVTYYRFPGQRILEWAIVLPLAIPAYLVAYIYTDLLEYAGPLQKTLRQVFGWGAPADYWFPEIRSPGGAMAIMTLTLYPYVYLLARAAFVTQSAALMEAARVLGQGPWRAFFRVALPVARPAVVAGVALALMETLNDFGVVDFFAVPTFTAGIFDVWLNMNDTPGAAQLAVVMLVFVLFLLHAERRARRGRRFDTTASRAPGLGHQLSGARALLVFAACAAPVLLGFVIPSSIMLSYALRFWRVSVEQGFFGQLANSLTLSLAAALIAGALGLLLAWAVRMDRSPAARVAARFASIGYAMPGAMLAVGLLIPLARADGVINDLTRSYLGVSPGLLLSGTLFALVYGYTARFMALAHGAAESGLARISPAMEDAARTLGAGPRETLARVHFPMLRASILTGGLIVFVDTMKELPATLLLRPFNFDTLATTAYQFATDELFEEAALGGLSIVAAGVLPLIILSRAIAARSKS